MNTRILAASWERDGFKLSVCIGSPAYSFYDGKELIFEGDDFKYPPIFSLGCFPLNPLPTLSRVCRRPGDEGTDPDQFRSYTERQLAWCQSDRCELLRRIVDEIKQSLPPEFRSGHKIY